MKRNTRIAALVLSATVLALIGLNIGLPVKLRFADPALNYGAALALALLLPFAAGTLGALAQPRSRWLIFVVVWFGCAVPCSIFSLLTYWEARGIQERGADLSYQLLDTAPGDDVVFRLYLTNCGATCSWGLDLRSERDGPFGMRVVRSIWSAYKTDNDARLIQTGPGLLQVVEAGGRTHEVQF